MTDQGQPMQSVILDNNGTARFKKNKIVEYLLDNGGIDLNQIAMRNFSDEDRMQFAQLIGYSVSGYGDLSYVSDASYDEAHEVAETLLNPDQTSMKQNPFKITTDAYVQDVKGLPCPTASKSDNEDTPDIEVVLYRCDEPSIPIATVEIDKAPLLSKKYTLTISNFDPRRKFASRPGLFVYGGKVSDILGSGDVHTIRLAQIDDSSSVSDRYPETRLFLLPEENPGLSAGDNVLVWFYPSEDE